MFFEDNDLKTVFRALSSKGHEVYLVGGCVRDTVLGKKPNDYDLATNAEPSQMIDCFAGYKMILTGLKHGTVTVIVNHRPFEITTFRVDGEYDDHRHPKRVTFSKSLVDDLSRRDFTVNAMAFSPDGELVDVFGGRDDLKNGIIRCVGDANRRFKEDALRILRAIRFSSTLDFEVEKNTKEAIFENRDLLKLISVERIFAELSKTLISKAPERMRDFYEVIKVLIPEFSKETFLNGLDTVCKISSENKSMHLLLAAFLCFAVDVNQVKSILKRLKTDKKTLTAVSNIISYRDVDVANNLVQTVREVGYDHIRDIVRLKMAMGTYEKDKANRLLQCLDEFESSKLCVSLKDLAVNGDDLIYEGFKTGKSLGDTLEFLLEGVVGGLVENQKTALLQYAKDNFKI